MCDCAKRRVPCDKHLEFDRKDNCENETAIEKNDYSLSSLKTSESKMKISFFLDKYLTFFS